MWRSRKHNLKRRMVSGILACLLVATSLTNTVGVISAFAAQGTDVPRVSYKYDDLKNDRGDLDKLVQINVQAENESFLPGSEMVLKVYVQNLSGQYLTGGSLKWNGKGLEEAGFLDEEEEDVFNGPGWDNGGTGDSAGSDTTGGQDGGLMEELGSFSVTGLRKSVALRVDDTNTADGTDGEEGLAPEEKPEAIGGMDFTEITEIQDSEEDDSDEPETDEEGRRIKGIELAPGEVYETRFYGTVEELESIVTRKVTFEFLAGVDGNDQKLAQDKAEFTYNTGMALVLPVEFEDGPALMTNELNTLYIRTRFEDEKILDEYTWDVTDGDGDEATPADAQRHEITVATMSNGDGDSSEGTTPANMKYSIVTYGAKLQSIEAWRDEDKSDWGEVATGVSFRVADGTEPGVYFGQVTTSIRRDGKSYKTTQGFHFFVLGDGQIVLKGNVNGAEIQVKGDRESFPEGDMLSLKVTEVPEEKMGLVQEAMAQKADELGVSVDKMMAVDIKVIADGIEQELRGDVQVTFSNLKMESVDGNLDGNDSAEAAEANDAAEAEEFEEISNHSVFSLRKAAAQNDDIAQEHVDDLADETESQNESEDDSNEESSLAVWHFNEDAGAIDEMDSETNDDGDVVMTTEHFSIFIVVNVPDVQEVTVTVKHFAMVDVPDIVSPNQIYNHQQNKNVTKTFSEPDSIRKDDVVAGTKLYPGTDDQTTGKYTQVRKEIYSQDTFKLPNGGGTGIGYTIPVEDLSKLLVKGENEEIYKTGGNYKLKSITVNGVPKTSGNVELQKNNVIEIDYEPTIGTKRDFVEFHDYNVSVEGNDGNVHPTVNTQRKGINSEGLSIQSGTGDRIGVGINNEVDSGVRHGYMAAAAVFKTDMPKEIGADDLIKFNYQDPGLFIRKDITIGDQIAKKYLTNYELEFNRKGDTYTLSAVYKKNTNGSETRQIGNLDELKHTTRSGRGMNLFTNLFWPLDGENYDGRDPLFPGWPWKESIGWNGKPSYHGSTGFPVNDEFVWGNKDGINYQGPEHLNHNWYFGMRYDFEFTLGDYIGPLDYYFRGDDDFWLFIDGELVNEVDLGGVHIAEGAYVDLKQWLHDHKGYPSPTNWSSKVTEAQKKAVHKMSVFFMERGGTGSCCYMRFTLPHIVEVNKPTSATIDKSVKKVWTDGNEKHPNDEVTVQLLQDGKPYGVPVTLSSNTDSSKNWKHTWSNLPAFKNVGGEENDPHIYTVEEVPVQGYKSVISDYINDNGEKIGFIITNIKTDYIKVEKQWDVTQWEDQGVNSNTSIPSSIMVHLQKRPKGSNNENDWKDATVGEGFVNPVELKANAQNPELNWKYAWQDMPLYEKNGDRYVELEYRVVEESGSWIKTQQNPDGWYEVTYPENEDNDFIIKNTYIPSIISKEVEKKWKLDREEVYNGDEKFGLRPTKIKVQLKRKGAGAEAVYKEAELNEANSWKCKWDDLPEYYYEKDSTTGQVRRVKYMYTIQEVIEESPGKDYYVPTYSPENITNVDKTTITNTLQTARFRVAKRIDNYGSETEEIDKKDLDEDEFIVEVEKDTPDGNPFKTGLVLKHAANTDQDVLKHLDKVSGYIIVPVKTEGVFYTINEIVPKEYDTNYVNTTGISIVNERDILAEKVGNNQVKIKPGVEAIVIVHNQFSHDDFFHNDASVINKFLPGLKDTTSASVPESEPVDMLTLIPEYILAPEREEGKQRRLDEDDRLV